MKPILVIFGEATHVECPRPWRNPTAIEYTLRSHITQAGLSLKDVCIKPLHNLQRKDLTPDSIIVACGYAATVALTSKDLKVNDTHCYVYQTPNGIPVVCALHPITIYSEPNRGHWLGWAFKKAKMLANGGELHPTPDLTLNPNLQQALDFMVAAQTAPIIALDIEKPKAGHELACFSIATSNRRAISIPFMGRDKVSIWSPEDEAQIWKALAELLLCPNEKVFQNFIFDTMCFGANGLPVKGTIYCTMSVANMLNPRLEKGLGDLGRIYCYAPAWKEKHDWNLGGDPISLWHYNALDAIYTFHICEQQKHEIQQRNLQGFYDKHVGPLYDLVLSTCMRGVRCDVDALENARLVLESTLAPIKQTLKEFAAPVLAPKITKKKYRDPEKDKVENGKIKEKAYKEVLLETPQEFNPNSPTQTKQVLKALGYKLPTKQGKETTDRCALLKLNRKQPSDFILGLIRWTQLSKMLSSYATIVLDSDQRIRYSFAVGGTKSGRFSSSSTPWDTGLNVQTLPRPTKEVPVNIRACVLPDPGMTLVQVDLSQAELRVVAWLSGDEKLIELLESGQDIHQYTADAVSRVTGTPVPRAIGKMLNHASNYGMRENRFSDACLEDAGLVVTPEEAKTLLEARKKTFPGVVRWQANVEDTLKRTRRLTSPHGRTSLFYGPIDEGTIRDALSFIPQATVADMTNQAWIKLSRLAGYNRDFNVLQQGHDSLLIQVLSEKLNSFLIQVNEIYASLEVVVNGKILLVPHDVTVGDSWGNLKEIK